MAPGSNDLSHVHEPVLVAEVLEHLLPQAARMADGLVVDGTVGGGGHAAAVLDTAPAVRLLGLDRDPAALEAAGQRLSPYGERVELEHGSYGDLPEVLERRKEAAPIAVLFDLGLSSLQLDRLERGFSFRGGDAVPDMRFDPSGPEASAAELVNHSSERELATWLHEYGEEPRARAVARALVKARPIRSVAHLREVTHKAALRVKRHDAATRTFQALRIAVNDEFGHLSRGLGGAIVSIADGGRLVVICFHSGEERLVKAAFKTAVTAGHGRVLTRKPIRPTRDEVRRNPRARPARLRAFEVSRRIGEEAEELIARR